MTMKPEVRINLNIDVKVDDTTSPDLLRCQLDDAIGRAYILIKKIESTEPAPTDSSSEQNPNSRHQKAVTENRRISKAIEYINEKMPVLEISTGAHNFEHRLVLQRIRDILLGRQKY